MSDCWHRIWSAHIDSKTGKNDANDAAAVCEAASRPCMHFVAIKTVDQQGVLSVPGIARLSLARMQEQLSEFERHIKWWDERIAAHVKTDERARTRPSAVWRRSMLTR